jgi:4-coumarate--CoA ligase
MSYDPSTGIYTSPVDPIRLVLDQDIHTFIFHHQSPLRPLPQPDSVWLINSTSRQRLTYTDCFNRTEEIAKVLKYEYQVSDNDVVGIFSENNVNFPLVCWASFRLGGIMTPANPSYTLDELVYQLETVRQEFKVKCLFISSQAVEIAIAATSKIEGLDKENIVILDGPGRNGVKCLEELIVKWKDAERVGPTPSLSNDGGKRKLAFLNFSRQVFHFERFDFQFKHDK